MKVPAVPEKLAGETLFIWPGIQPGNALSEANGDPAGVDNGVSPSMRSRLPRNSTAQTGSAAGPYLGPIVSATQSFGDYLAHSAIAALLVLSHLTSGGSAGST